MSWLKSLSAPSFWPYKEGKFRPKAGPGPHNKNKAIPISILMRDYFKICDTMKEAKGILSKGVVKINNQMIHNPRLPVGLMDVVEVMDDSYIMLPTRKGILPVKQNKPVKLSRIDNKTALKNGRVQLNLHDGRNIQIDKNQYKTGDVIIHSENKIEKVLELREGNIVLITGGRNIGKVGKVKQIKKTKDFRPTTIVIEISGEKTPILKDYVFVVGKQEPVIKLGESDERNSN